MTILLSKISMSNDISRTEANIIEDNEENDIIKKYKFETIDVVYINILGNS